MQHALHSKNRVQNFAVQNRCLKKLDKVLPNLVLNTKSLKNVITLAIVSYQNSTVRISGVRK